MRCRVQDTRKMFYPDLFSFVWRRHVGVSLRRTNMAAGNRQKFLPLSFPKKREFVALGTYDG